MMVAVPLPIPLLDLVAGSTLLLGLGAAIAGVASAPVHRQRAAELAVVATVLWLAIAAVPLPRWSFGHRAVRAVSTMANGGASGVTAPAGPGATSRQGSTRAAAQTSAVARSADGASSAAHDPRSAGARPVGSDRAFAAAESRVRWAARVHRFGTALLAGYVLLGFVLVRRLLRAATVAPPWLAGLFAERAARLGVRNVRLRVGGARRPLTTGLIHPAIVLPTALARPGREADLRRVLDHELIHVQRRDVLGRTVFAVSAPLLWLHPLFWWLRSRAALAAELIADDQAAGADRAGYARGLLALAGELQALLPAPGHAPGTFRNRSELTRRIDMLTSRHPAFAATCSPRRRALHAGVLTVALGGAVAFLGARPLPAQQEPAATAPPLEGESKAARKDLPDAAAAAQAGASAAIAETAAAATATVPAPALAPSPSAAADTEGLTPAASTAGTETLLSQLPQDPDPGYAATLTLVERALTLQSELSLAQAELASRRKQEEAGAVVPEMSMLSAQIALEGLQRRLDAVRILVSTEIEATKMEIQQLDQAIRVGTEGPEARPRLIRLTARLRILEQVF